MHHNLNFFACSCILLVGSATSKEKSLNGSKFVQAHSFSVPLCSAQLLGTTAQLGGGISRFQNLVKKAKNAKGSVYGGLVMFLKKILGKFFSILETP